MGDSNPQGISYELWSHFNNIHLGISSTHEKLHHCIQQNEFNSNAISHLMYTLTVIMAKLDDLSQGRRSSTRNNHPIPRNREPQVYYPSYNNQNEYPPIPSQEVNNYSSTSEDSVVNTTLEITTVNNKDDKASEKEAIVVPVQEAIVVPVQEAIVVPVQEAIVVPVQEAIVVPVQEGQNEAVSNKETPLEGINDTSCNLNEKEVSQKVWNNSSVLKIKEELSRPIPTENKVKQQIKQLLPPKVIDVSNYLPPLPLRKKKKAITAGVESDKKEKKEPFKQKEVTPKEKEAPSAQKEVIPKEKETPSAQKEEIIPEEKEEEILSEEKKEKNNIKKVKYPKKPKEKVKNNEDELIQEAILLAEKEKKENPVKKIIEIIPKKEAKLISSAKILMQKEENHLMALKIILDDLITTVNELAYVFTESAKSTYYYTNTDAAQNYEKIYQKKTIREINSDDFVFVKAFIRQIIPAIKECIKDDYIESAIYTYDQVITIFGEKITDELLILFLQSYEKDLIESLKQIFDVDFLKNLINVVNGNETSILHEIRKDLFEFCKFFENVKIDKFVSFTGGLFKMAKRKLNCDVTVISEASLFENLSLIHKEAKHLDALYCNFFGKDIPLSLAIHIGEGITHEYSVRLSIWYLMELIHVIQDQDIERALITLQIEKLLPFYKNIRHQLMDIKKIISSDQVEENLRNRLNRNFVNGKLISIGKTHFTIPIKEDAEYEKIVEEIYMKRYREHKTYAAAVDNYSCYFLDMNKVSPEAINFTRHHPKLCYSSEKGTSIMMPAIRLGKKIVYPFIKETLEDKSLESIL